MKYIETKLDHLAAFDDSVKIVPSPDAGEATCLSIGEEHYMPFVGWMKYDSESESWVEIDPEDEESFMNHLAENCTFREVSQRDAGERFSNNVEFLE